MSGKDLLPYSIPNLTTGDIAANTHTYQINQTITQFAIHCDTNSLPFFTLDDIDPAQLDSDPPVLDVSVLLRAFNTGISDELFTCGCGFSGCAGIRSESAIVHEEDIILLVLPNPLTWRPHLDLPAERGFNLYYIDMDQFRQEVKKLAMYLLEKYKQDFTQNTTPYGMNLGELMKTCIGIVNWHDQQWV